MSGPIIKDPRERYMSPMLRGLIDAILGPGGIQTQPAMAPIFRVGNKALKNIGGVWRIQEGEKAAKALKSKGLSTTKKLASTPTPESVRAIEELPDIVNAPAIASSIGPKLSTIRGTGPAMKPTSRPNVKVNPSIVKDIRTLYSKNKKSIAAIRKAYPDLAEETLRSIISRDTWSWVK